MRLRIGIDGKLFGFIAIHWTYARAITSSELVSAQWLRAWLDGVPVKLGNTVTGKFFVEIAGG